MQLDTQLLYISLNQLGCLKLDLFKFNKKINLITHPFNYGLENTVLSANTLEVTHTHLDDDKPCLLNSVFLKCFFFTLSQQYLDYSDHN